METLVENVERNDGRSATVKLSHLASPRSLAKTLAGILALWFVRPLRDLSRSLKRDHPIRVFTFHRISDQCKDGMTVSPELFRRQLKYVMLYHEVVEPGRALQLLRGGANLSRPMATVTFDDAYRSVYDAAAPIMDELGCPGGFCFATTDFVGTDRSFPWDSDDSIRRSFSVMSWEQLANLQKRGWVIGGHTATHPRLADCDESQLQGELGSSLTALRTQLGVEDVPMAYPFGKREDISAEGLRMIQASGYSACFSNFGGENFPPTPLHEIRRIDIGGAHNTLAWKTRVHGIDLGDWRRRVAGWFRGGSGGSKG